MLEAGFIKFHQFFQKLLVIGGGEHSNNVLCLSFVVVLYSMYSVYAVIKMVLLDEGGCHV